jgi:hypothetical protein
LSFPRKIKVEQRANIQLVIFVAMWKNKYLWLTVLFAWLFCMFFMGKLWMNPNDWVFSKSGDGLQAYYQSIWHVRYDSTFWQQSSMNYPFGESIFFTGGQPLVSNLVLFLKPLVDLSGHMVAITNMMMLSSALFCAAFLFLIFDRLKLQPWMAIGAAIVIMLTTQQWERMRGHFPLAWMFAIPGMLYLLMWYYDKISWKKSFWIMLFVLFLSFGHMYYIVFFGVIAGSFFLAHAARSSSRQRLRMTLHFLLQAALPFVILQLLVSYSSDVTDRTILPWGFLEFRSTWASYLYPYGLWYEKFFYDLKPKFDISWEGISYIGGASYLILMILFCAMVYYLLKRQFHHFRMDVTSWALLLSFVFCMIISFAFPFNLGLEDWLSYTGPLQQFRGIGRFASVAFFPLSILLFSSFSRTGILQGKAGILLFPFVLIVGLKEGVSKVRSQVDLISNVRGEVLCGSEHLPDELKTKKYQALLPLPFFHIGSENIWLADEAELARIVFDVSEGLQLPTFAVLMSRTSVSQTFKSIALTSELMEYPEILKQLPSDYPFLVIADTSRLSTREAILISHASFICNWDKRQFYELSPKAFAEIMKEQQGKLPPTPYQLDEFCMLSDSAQQAFFIPTDTSYFFDDQNHRMIESHVPTEWRGKKVKISFWIEDFVRDLIPRTRFEIIQLGQLGIMRSDGEICGRRIVGLYHGNALIEYEIEIDSQTERIEVLCHNRLLPGKNFRAFSFLIRPDSLNCAILRDGKRSYNNRLFD